MDGKLGGIAGFLVLVAIAFGVKFMRQGSDGEDLLKEARAMITHVEGYDKDRAYYDWLVEHAHDECFSDAYTMGMGRRSRGTVDVERYLTDLFAIMIAKAANDKSPHIAAALTTFRDEEFGIGDDPGADGPP